MRPRLRHHLIVVAGIALAVIALASEGRPRAGAAGHDPCKEDARKFCSGATPGGGLALCLKEHEGALSPACREQVAKDAEEIDACRDDIAKICWDEKPGHGRIVKCLKQHRTDLSDACKTALARPKK